MLDVKGLSVRYGMIDAVRDVSLSVGEGEIVSLIGANGAGKSSLLNAISAIVPSSTGTVSFDGRSLQGLSAEDIVQLGLIQVPEGRQIFAQMTVLENLTMGAYTHRRRFERKEMDQVFELFPRLHERRDQAAGLLSGGEQQMLAIGRALMSRPKLLLLDEPSMGLAPIIVKLIFGILRSLHARGIAILLVEQNAKAALTLSERTYVLTNGQITREGRSDSLLDNPEIQEAFLGSQLKRETA
jgi:branched-chain amino acid transport system ATP-binding protein